MKRPDWITDLREVLKGIEDELALPAQERKAFEDVQAMLDNVRTMVWAVIESRDGSNYFAALRDIRMWRANALLGSVLADVTTGRITKETIGIKDLENLLDEMTPAIDDLTSKRSVIRRLSPMAPNPRPRTVTV